MSQRRRIVGALTLALLATTTACGGAGGAAVPTPAPTTSATRSAAQASTPAPTPATSPRPSITVPSALLDVQADRTVLGADISWPQCPKGMGIPEKRSSGAPLPLPQAKFVVLGLTNGPAFTPNPCLASQLAWAKARTLLVAAYAVHSFPDRATVVRQASSGPYDDRSAAGRLRNVGYAQARYNVATMKRVGLRTPIVWLDIEPVPKFEWSNDTAANAQVVVGAERAYRDAGYATGVYSTQHLWQTVVGDLRLGLPEWRAAGETSRAEALRRCGTSRMFQGGTAVLSQWLEDDRDQNVTCPGTAVRMSLWFHQLQ